MALQQFLRILMARRWIIILAVCASLIGAFLVAVIVPPRYQASTRVILDIIKPDPVTGQILANQFVRTFTKTQIELIKDYKVAGRVVDDLGWTSNPTMLEAYGGSGDPETARRLMAQRIIDATDARLIEGSNILEITYTGWSPDASKTVADLVRGAYIDVSLAFKRDSATQSADWYQEQTEKARRSLAIAEQNMSQFERRHGIVMQADRTDLESARLAAMSQQGTPPVGAAIPVTPGPLPSALELARVDAQLAQARRTLGSNHPTLTSLQQQRNALASQAAQERAAAASAGSAAANAANALSGSSRRELEAQKAKVIGNRENLAQLRQLQDEVDLRRGQYQKASARVAELRLQGDVSETGLTVLGSAVAPEKPSFPNIPLITFVALGFGLVLGILVALVTELLNRRIRVARDLLDAASEVPILAIIGSSKSGASSGFLERVRRFGKLNQRVRDEALAA
jgi:uncharacterized protein involved in exopolysaccharide biosynthesis